MTEKESFIDFLERVTRFIYENYSSEIMEAHEVFWEEERPEEILGGILLEIGEMNFNDYLLFDYKNVYGQRFLDLYEKEGDFKSGDEPYIKKAKESRISLYEVDDISGDNLTLKDLLLGNKYNIRSNTLKDLKKGDLFATRLIYLDGRYEILPCAYPFKASHKEEIMELIDKQFKRYLKNENPQGTMKDFLDDHSQFFNVLWMDFVSK